MRKEIEIYQAKDFLFCKPDNPIYEEILSSGNEWHNIGDVIGYSLKNIIRVCDRGSFVTAIKNPANDYSLLVFGLYPVQSFLLKPVGKISIKPKPILIQVNHANLTMAQ